LNILLIGEGKNVSYAAIKLIKSNNVTIVSKMINYYHKSLEKKGIRIICGEILNEEVFEKVVTNETDLVFALTKKDSINLAVCHKALKEFSINKTVALANDPYNIPVFKKFGINKVISSADTILNIIGSKE
jgi:trk system potassium uptake protein TrkA